MSRVDRAVATAARAASEIANAYYSRFEIVRFARHRDGYFQAIVSIQGNGSLEAEKFYVHCKFGSWLLPVPNDDPNSRHFRDVLSPYKEALAERARDFDYDERRRLNAAVKRAAEAAQDAVVDMSASGTAGVPA